MSVHSLEEERRAILSRIRASREEYRRALRQGSDIHPHADDFGAAPAHGMVSHYAQPHNPAAEMAGAAVTWARRHPFLCVAAIAAVAAIGPRRLARSAVSGGTALTTLTLRNPQNIDTLTRLISSVAGYMQRGRDRYSP